MPRQLIAARRGVSDCGHSVESVLTWNGLLSKSILGFGVAKLTHGGMRWNFHPVHQKSLILVTLALCLGGQGLFAQTARIGTQPR